MRDKEKISKDDFQKSLEDLINKIGIKELNVEKDSLKTFCELTHHNYSFYLEKNLIPQGYLMTFTIPLFTQFFITASVDLIPKVIKGVIHTFSKIEYFGPFRMDQKYFGKIGVKNVVEKKGKMGEYFAVDFEILVSNEKGEKVASDVHQFFLRI